MYRGPACLRLIAGQRQAQGDEAELDLIFDQPACLMTRIVPPKFNPFYGLGVWVQHRGALLSAGVARFKYPGPNHCQRDFSEFL
jgi:hypothetical protein